MLSETEYHIHVNALALSGISRIALLEYGLKSRPFILDAPGTHYTPDSHYSFKCGSKDLFESTFTNVEKKLCEDEYFVGYAEGEFVSKGHDFRASIAGERNGKQVLRELCLGFPEGWRESEVHIGFQADEELCSRFRKANFYLSAIEKEGRLWFVATAQGPTKIVDRVYDHILSVDWDRGLTPSNVKVESLLRYFTSPSFNWKPPQIINFDDSK